MAKENNQVQEFYCPGSPRLCVWGSITEMAKAEKIEDMVLDPEIAGLIRRSLESWNTYASAGKSPGGRPSKNSGNDSRSSSNRDQFFEIAHMLIAFYNSYVEDLDLEAYWVIAEDYDLEHVKAAFRASHNRTGRQSRKFPSLVEFVKHIAVGTQK